MQELRGELDAMHAEILSRSRRPMGAVELGDPVALVDGAVVSALIEAAPDLRARARSAYRRRP